MSRININDDDDYYSDNDNGDDLIDNFYYNVIFRYFRYVFFRF